MNLISKLYFNSFKKMGNLRLMFVISCFFCIISTLIITIRASYKVKIININNFSLQETLEAYSPYSELFGDDKLRNYVDIMEDTQEHKKLATKLIVMRKYCLAGYNDKAYEFAQVNLKEVFGKDNPVHCPNEKPLATAYSIGYLWNYLWVIFWFYLPFILILPIKFVIEGYGLDKKNNKVKK